MYLYGSHPIVTNQQDSIEYNQNVVVRFRKIRLYMSVMRLAMRMSYEDIPLVELIYLVFTRMPGELPPATQVSVAVLVCRLSSADLC